MQETSHQSDMGQHLVLRIGQHTIALLVANGPHVADYEETEMKSGISVAANLREWLKSHPQLPASYEQVDILLHTPSLLVPADEFDAEEADMLYKYTFSGHDHNMVAHEHLADHHAVAVFGIDKDLSRVMADHFATCRWLPVSLPVWRYVGKQNSHHDRNRQRLHIYLHDGHAEVFSFNGSHFKFCNSFAASHPKDVLYYVLNAFTQQGMKASRDEVVVLGSMANKQWLVQQLESYVERVTEPDLTTLLPDAPTATPMPADLIFMTIV